MWHAKNTGEDLSPDALFEQIREALSLVTDLDPGLLEEMTPSELRLLWEAFREVNADFFGLVRSGLLGAKVSPPNAG